MVKGIPSCQARKLQHKDTERTECSNSSKLSLSDTPSPSPRQICLLNQCLCSPSHNKENFSPHEIAAEWTPESRICIIPPTKPSREGGDEGPRRTDRTSRVLWGKTWLLGVPPAGGVGAGRLGLPEDWAWGATEDGESASPPTAAAPRRRPGNNNTGGRESPTRGCTGRGAAGGAGTPHGPLTFWRGVKYMS